MLTVTPVRPKLLSVTAGDPAAALISTADAKTYLNVSTSDENDLIDALVLAATRAAEKYTHLAFITQAVTTRYRASSFPLRVYRPPIISITSVTSYYQGDAGTAEDKTEMYVSGGSGRRPKLMLKEDFEWTATEIEEIGIVASCGFGATASAVPPPILQAVRLILNQFYDHRDEFVTGTIVQQLPFDARCLLNPFVAPIL